MDQRQHPIILQIDKLDLLLSSNTDFQKIRNQLSFLKEQAEAFESEFKILKCKYAWLKKEANLLSATTLEDESLGILIFLFETDRSQFSTQTVASWLGDYKVNEVQYHFDQLIEAGLMEITSKARALPYDDPTLYSLSQSGRTFVLRGQLPPGISKNPGEELDLD
jgi:hypothetical protein